MNCEPEERAVTHAGRRTERHLRDKLASVRKDLVREILWAERDRRNYGLKPGKWLNWVRYTAKQEAKLLLELGDITKDEFKLLRELYK